LGGFQRLQKITYRCAHQFGFLDQRPVLSGYTPDSPTLPVSLRVVKIYFAMLDNRIIPISNINGPVGTDGNIYRPEGNVIGPEQVGHLLGSISTTLLFQF